MTVRALAAVLQRQFVGRPLLRALRLVSHPSCPSPPRGDSRPGRAASDADRRRMTVRPGPVHPKGLPRAAGTTAPYVIGMVCVDGQGRILHFDWGAELMFGRRADEVVGERLSVLVGEAFLDVLGQCLATCLTPGGAGVFGVTVETAGRRTDGSESRLQPSQAGWGANPGGFLMAILRDTTESRLAQRALHRVNELREDEARRIARELHDEAGQLLASVHIALLEWAEAMQASSSDQLRRVIDLLDQIEGRLRDLSHEVRPTILDDLGLVPALEFLAGRISKRTGLSVSVDGSVGERLPAVIETTLYRVVQEALTNVARHARATSVGVRIEREDGLIRCAIRDNGVGFDVSEILSRRGAHGLGLMGIRERVVSLAGSVRIESAPGRGTTLLATIPLDG